MDDFLVESAAHGWPSFRDAEVRILRFCVFQQFKSNFFRLKKVNWEFVRCLPNGEAVSIDGTHLGHNLPDAKGSRYCINLVSVAGRKK